MAYGAVESRWPLMLAMIGVGWLAATTVTALGMYMVACHANARPHLPTYTQNHANAKPHLPTHAQDHLTKDQLPHQLERGVAKINWCVGKWSVDAGHMVLVVGSLLNLALLVTMLVLLVRERRTLTVAPDPPPDYEMLIKSETPPPSFAEVQLRQQELSLPAPPYTPAKEGDTGSPPPTITTISRTGIPSTMV